MGNSQTTSVAIKTDKLSYYPGQTISSSIFINSPKPHLCSKVVLHIEGYQESEFKPDVGNYDVQNSQNTLIRTFFVLKEFNSLKSYLHGQYEFPCTFTLPWVVPGSFSEQKKGYKAKIVYYMKVILVSPKGYKDNFEKIHEFVIRQPQTQIDQNQMGTILIHPQCLLWKNLGVCSVRCWFEKKNYLPKDECVVICQIDNRKSKRNITRVKCQLVKTITLKANNGIYKTIKETINTIQFKGAQRGESFDGSLAQKSHLPLQYRNSATGIHPSTTGNLVRCEYSISVTTQVGGCFTKGDKTFAVNLKILHPELAQKIEQPSVWKPEVQQYSKIQIKQMNPQQMRQSINAYAAD